VTDSGQNRLQDDSLDRECLIKFGYYLACLHRAQWSQQLRRRQQNILNPGNISLIHYQKFATSFDNAALLSNDKESLLSNQPVKVIWSEMTSMDLYIWMFIISFDQQFQGILCKIRWSSLHLGHQQYTNLCFWPRQYALFRRLMQLLRTCRQG